MHGKAQSPGFPLTEVRPLLRVLIIYEDFAVGRRAIDTYSSLTAQFSDSFEFRNSMWKFDLLQHPKLKEIAAGDAAEAELVIVAARGDNPLPDEVLTWAEIWVPRRTRGGALAALLEPQNANQISLSSVLGYLKEVAARAGMDFLSGPMMATPRSGSPPSIGPSKSQELPPEPSGIRHWGLNE